MSLTLLGSNDQRSTDIIVGTKRVRRDPKKKNRMFWTTSVEMDSRKIVDRQLATTVGDEQVIMLYF
jgi:hypothetical protein